jgi:hypothetical protein
MGSIPEAVGQGAMSEDISVISVNYNTRDLLEVMACKTSVVALNTSSMPEVLADVAP